MWNHQQYLAAAQQHNPYQAQYPNLGQGFGSNPHQAPPPIPNNQPQFGMNQQGYIAFEPNQFAGHGPQGQVFQAQNHFNPIFFSQPEAHFYQNYSQHQTANAEANYSHQLNPQGQNSFGALLLPPGFDTQPNPNISGNMDMNGFYCPGINSPIVMNDVQWSQVSDPINPFGGGFPGMFPGQQTRLHEAQETKDFSDFSQFLHQMTLRMQPTSGIGDQYVDAARFRGLKGVKNDRRRICAAALRDYGHLIAIAPHF